MSDAEMELAINPDEQITSVMIYTANKFIWGDLITKKTLTAGRILLGVNIPDYLSLHNAQMVLTEGSKFSDRYKFNEFHVASKEIMGFHLTPPNQEPLDYDPNEPNRIMAAAGVLVGAFMFNGNFRISAQTDIRRMLGVSKGLFLSLYDVEIKQIRNPNANPIKTDFAIIRREHAIINVSH